MTTTLYRNGAICSPVDPHATAVLVVQDTIAWLGRDDAAAGHETGADDVVDLDGALVTPAFVDAHAHVTETGLALTGVELGGARSLNELLSRVEDAARRGRGRPVLGHGWDERRWPEQRPPTMTELDRASFGGSVYLSRVDVHSAVVSSAVAAAAGLRNLAGWAPDGRVEREAHAAARDATRASLTAGQRQDLQRSALRAAAAAGVGAVHEMSAPHIGTTADLQGLVRLALDEPLPEVVPYRGELVRDAGEARGLVSGLDLPAATPVRGLAGDICIDGSIGSRTAGLRAPYSDAPATSGHRYLDPHQVRDHVVACTQAGLQAGFHVIGDGAAQVAAQGLRLAEQEVGAEALRRGRHRLEHLEMVDDDVLAVLVDLGVHASVQPVFDAWWGGDDGLYAERLGVGRSRGMNRFADLASSGVPLALGSDSPVTPFAPWEAVRACAYHHDHRQRISVSAAVAAHTRGGWRAGGDDHGGVIAPGAPATIAVWSPSGTRARSGTPGLPDLAPGTTAPHCRRTVVRGRVVHDEPGA